MTETEAYRFATDLVELDLDRFDELLERSAHEPTGRAREALEQALDLVRGEVLEDEPYASWAVDFAAATRAASSAPASTRPTRRWRSSISLPPSRTRKRLRRSIGSASALTAARCSPSTRSGAPTKR